VKEIPLIDRFIYPLFPDFRSNSKEFRRNSEFPENFPGSRPSGWPRGLYVTRQATSVRVMIMRTENQLAVFPVPLPQATLRGGGSTQTRCDGLGVRSRCGLWRAGASCHWRRSLQQCSTHCFLLENHIFAVSLPTSSANRDNS
jgi:hypothetical protein